MRGNPAPQCTEFPGAKTLEQLLHLSSFFAVYQTRGSRLTPGGAFEEQGVNKMMRRLAPAVQRAGDVVEIDALRIARK